VLHDAASKDATMKITFFDGHMTTSDTLRERAESRIGSALRPYAERIGDVEVRVADINGARGGQDKQCRILAYINGGGPVNVEHTNGDYYAALDLATDKLRAAVGKKLKK
jgi:putative sigma-54 modulation protein